MKLQNKMIVIGHCPLSMNRNITKQLCMTVHKLLAALLTLELVLPDRAFTNATPKMPKTVAKILNLWWCSIKSVP